MANMQRRSPQSTGRPLTSYLIAPLVGAFFVDLMNAVVLTLWLALPIVEGRPCAPSSPCCWPWPSSRAAAAAARMPTACGPGSTERLAAGAAGRDGGTGQP
ncbi:hypothetical protein ACU4GD_37180 [Cupriavidus basilensis]